MENLKLDSFLEYKFLSNLDFNADGSNLAFSLSEADLENNTYKHFIYNLDTKNKRSVIFLLICYNTVLNIEFLIFIYRRKYVSKSS